jgi:hypothetical protein
MSSKVKERWKRLEALGAKSEIPTPEGEAKMSAVITQLAEPLLKQHGTNAKRAEAIISLTVAAWNKSMFPPDKRPIIEMELIDCFIPKDGNAEDVGIVTHIMDIVADRREELFPELRKIIVDYEVDISGDQLNLNVTSASVPDIG